jgi:hypothetical protein
MSALTFIVIVVILYGVFSSHGYGRALALGGATSAGAFVSFGATTIPTFYAVACGGVLILGVRTLLGPHPSDQPRFREIPGLTILGLFLAWSVLVTLVSPILFNGAPIVSPTATNLVAGRITSSNIAQVAYLVLGIGVVVLLARSRRVGREIIGLTLWVALALSLWRYLNMYAGVPFPVGLFDNSTGFVYIQTEVGGAARFRGIFSEPAALASAAVAAIAYGLSTVARVRGAKRLGPLVLIAISIFLGVVSTSTTFVVAIVALAVIAGLTFGLGFLSRRTRFSVGVTVLACALAIAAVWALPAIGSFVATTLGDKVGTASYAQRSSADSDSYRVFIDTWGIGVGLGAGRASSLLPTLLSTTGLIGTLLYAAAILEVGVRSFPIRHLRPVLWTLVALLVVRLISGPDPFDTTGLLWLCLGVLGHGVLEERRLRSPAVVSRPLWSSRREWQRLG